jgi:hypothetical protein
MKSPHEMKIYAMQGHLFVNDPMGQEAEDAKRSTLKFLAKYVKNRVSNKDAKIASVLSPR